MKNKKWVRGVNITIDPEVHLILSEVASKQRVSIREIMRRPMVTIAIKESGDNINYND